MYTFPCRRSYHGATSRRSDLKRLMNRMTVRFSGADLANKLSPWIATVRETDGNVNNCSAMSWKLLVYRCLLISDLLNYQEFQ